MVAGLQNILNTLHGYNAALGLIVNTAKTVTWVFRNRGRLRDDENWLYNGVQIQTVNEL